MSHPAAHTNDFAVIGACIRMYPSKVYFDILDPDPKDIHVQDIAHHLSLTNRFGGGTPQPYSVLSHSLLVSRMVERMNLGVVEVRAALAHDFTEAYVQDVNGMLKKVDELAGYRQIEDNLSRVIETRLGLPEGSTGWPPVKEADKRAFEFECSFVRDSLSYVAPDPAKVRDEFYRRFIQLFPTSGAW